MDVKIEMMYVRFVVGAIILLTVSGLMAKGAATGVPAGWEVG